MKVLIATDGSKFSKRAIEESCRIFGNYPDSEMKVLSVFKNINPLPTVPFIIPENYQQQFDQEARAEAERITMEATKLIRRKCPNVSLTAEVEELSGGTVSQKIIEKTKEWRPDFVVVGTHGRGFWGRLTIGSVSDAVIHHAPCSVLVVRSRKKAMAKNNVG